MALPTKGRVIIDTTVGEIDIELWSKETPKACRNFLALAMEGYYDGVIFHRVVPSFLVQTGDKTGTGNGGESFYGEPFEDEVHPRLRFSHRGLVGMANNGQKNSNDSQFFITLDRADELHGQHTLFGKCMGDTVYNVMRIGEMELDKEGRPLYPPKIKSIRIEDNPFSDIVPRITAAERREQQRAKDQAQREREEEQRRKGAKKNVKLLSFGEDEEENEEEQTFLKKKPIFRPELVQKSTEVVPDFVVQGVPNDRGKITPSQPSKEIKTAQEKKEADILKIREQHAKEQASTENTRKAEIEKMEAEVRKLHKRQDDSDDEAAAAAKKVKRSFLGEELAKYSKVKGVHVKGKKRDEGDILTALTSFRGKLQNTMSVDIEGGGGVDVQGEGEGEGEEEKGDKGADGDGGGDGGMDVDDDVGFLAHELRFPKDNTEETQKAQREYEVIDPRQRGAQAREEEREKKAAATRARGGGGRTGRSWRS